MAILILCLVVVGAACGRSDPDGAAAADDPADEPASAGVQVTSSEPVITPVPTSATSATVPPTTVQSAGVYLVEPGDTLSVIAEQFGVTIAALSEANGITDIDTIKPGQELIIPAVG